ncbi:MAG: response regulator transcription factor [Lachnospiraceae bacterium]|nr:response regulator transcription factor [Lachnospiraceae bacterium]
MPYNDKLQGDYLMKYDCLIVDDEIMLSENTREYFNVLGVKTAWVADEESCLKFFRENDAGVILLDINLGNTSGFDLCNHLRKTINVPILFISARKSDDDVLLALNIGGDDYIKKPYSLAILLAKVKAVLKRHKINTADEGFFTDNDFHINFADRSVSLRGEKIELKAMEYKLLSYLVKNRNRAVTKDELFKNVWEDSFSDENTLNVHIRRLREKIEINPSEPHYIITVRGKGYLFEVK